MVIHVCGETVEIVDEVVSPKVVPEARIVLSPSLFMANRQKLSNATWLQHASGKPQHHVEAAHAAAMPSLAGGKHAN